MNEEKMKVFCMFLLMSSKEQFNYMIKSITKEQLQIILEILYNISNEIITISTEDKRRLKKYIIDARKLLSSDLKWTSRKRLLWKIKLAVPIILQNYLKYVKRTRVAS